MQNYIEWKNWNIENFASASFEERLYFKKLIKKFELGENLEVLEIGFGNGAFLDFAESIGWNISGVELNPSLVARAAQHGFNVYPSLFEIPDINKYDLIIALDVIEHIEETQIPNFLKKTQDLLSSNGSLILRVPNGSSPLGLANQHGDITHVSVITEGKMNYFTKSIDLKIDYKGSDPYLIYNGKLLKTPSRILKRFLQVLIERMIRWIYSPQSKGFLSANSVYLLSLRKK